MWATPFEQMLANIREMMPSKMYRVAKQDAYDRLREMTGQNFGNDYKKWEEWGFDNDKMLNPPPFLQCLRNLQGRVSPDSLYFLQHETLRETLKELTGQDFGCDAARWERWGRENGYLVTLR